MGQGRREFYAARTCADQHERHLSRAFVLILGRRGQFECAQDFGSDRLGVAEALETRCISRELVVPEIAGAHTGRDHQIIERNLADAHAGAAASIVREATSTPVTSARSTLTFRCFASSWRIGAAISAGERTAVAT